MALDIWIINHEKKRALYLGNQVRPMPSRCTSDLEIRAFAYRLPHNVDAVIAWLDEHAPGVETVNNSDDSHGAIYDVVTLRDGWVVENAWEDAPAAPLKLWSIKPTHPEWIRDADPDAYVGAVVVARTAREARAVHPYFSLERYPGGGSPSGDDTPWRGYDHIWPATPDEVMATEIGTPMDDSTAGTVIANYEAG